MVTANHVGCGAKNALSGTGSSNAPVWYKVVGVVSIMH